MSTRVATSVPSAAPRPEASASGSRRSARRLEFQCPPLVSQRLELDVRRSADGLLTVRGTCAPAGTYEEVEVCAGFERSVAKVDAKGVFSSLGLLSAASHVKVTLRGGPLPPIVFTRVPVTV